MASPRDELARKANESTAILTTATTGSLKYNQLGRMIRECIAMEEGFQKPDQELLKVLGDVIDIVEKRRNQFDKFATDYEPKHQKIMDQFLYGDE